MNEQITGVLFFIGVYMVCRRYSFQADHASEGVFAKCISSNQKY